MSFWALYFELGATNEKNWVGQKGHPGFSIRWHEKHEWTFWPTNTSQRSARTMRWRFLFLWLFPCLTKVTRAPFLSWMLTLVCARNHSLSLVSSGQGVIMAPYVTNLWVFYCALLVSLNSAHTFAGSTFIKLSSILPIGLPSISCADPEGYCPYFSLLFMAEQRESYSLMSSQHCILVFFIIHLLH